MRRRNNIPRPAEVHLTAKRSWRTDL